jgi:hypothetical protein
VAIPIHRSRLAADYPNPTLLYFYVGGG